MIDAGLPGEYNLRDIFRWCDLIKRQQVAHYTHFSYWSRVCVCN